MSRPRKALGMFLGKVIASYKTIYLNVPGTTRAAGVLLIAAVGMIHLIEAPHHLKVASYLGVLFLINAAGSVVAMIGVSLGARGWGWLLGAVISGLALSGYLVSRTIGLPGFAEGVGEWDDPVGSLAMIFEGLYLAGWVSVVTGLSVAAPDKRDWHD